MEDIAATSPAPAAPSLVASNVGAKLQQLPPKITVCTPLVTRPLAATGFVGTTNKDKGSPLAMIFHDTECFEAMQSILEQDINGPPVVQRLWLIKDCCSSGTLLEQDCDKGDLMSRLGLFCCMFPQHFLHWRE